MKNTLLLLLLFLLPVVASAQEEHIIYFDFDVAEANPLSAQSLKSWIDVNKDSEVIRINGYTDAEGTDAYNQKLSEKRIAYVHRMIKENGIDVTNVHQQAFGENYAGGGKSAADRKVVVVYNKPDVVQKAPLILTLVESIAAAKKGDKVRLPNLNFHNNSDVVLPESQPVLRELLIIMQINPNLKIDIQGHICCQKTDVRDVAKRRAKAIYRFLQLNGIADSRISYQSFGSSRPIYPLPEKNEEEERANRRVEIEILEN